MKHTSKKAIGPVVALALLLVVAVVAVVSFQSWFATFASSLYSEAESGSSDSLSTKIERVVGSTLYFSNGKSTNLSVTQVKVDGNDCNISSSVANGINELNLSSCLQNVSSGVKSEVVVTTDSGVYSNYFITSLPADPNPDAFSFTNQSNAPLNETVTSNTLVPTGYRGPLSVSITGEGSPELRVNSGSWTTSATMNPGDNLTIRLTTPDGGGFTSVANITLGSYTTSWSVTTQLVF